ncbi:MAG: hypothetical protein IPK37_09005 [Austwickia sp.]|jgi:hypothetical protein|nr:MAG: hypothetical protein IPK37_09005 [Austwickia sp.]
MTEPRFASPIPPYQAQGGPQDAPTRSPGYQGRGSAPLEGVVLGGPGASRARSAFGPVRPRYVRQKSLLLAGLLAFIFPPIGMLYGTIFGTLVMTFISIPVAIITAGHGLAALWPFCVLWAVWGAHRTNQRRLAWAALGL